MIQKIGSILTYFSIQLARILDHSWRRFTGMPTLKRSQITPTLYLGGQYYERGIHKLKKLGITGIVNMRKSSIRNLQGMDQITLLQLPTPDLQAPSIQDLLKGIDFIKQEIEKGGKVYIHCHHGEGRGPTMTIAYLMSTGLLYEDAYNLVKNVRIFIKPTPPQIKVLKELEKLLHPPLEI